MTLGLVIRAGYPISREGFADAEADRRMDLFTGLVTAARNIRSLYRVSPSARIELRIKTPAIEDSLVDEFSAGLRQLVRADHLLCGPDVGKEKGCASTPVGAYEVIVPLAGVADLEEEVARLRKERRQIQSDLAVVEGKLSNRDFLAKAKEEVVQKAREKRDTLGTELAKIEESLKIIGENP
jgi:valyl-tRNA synthetase